MDLSHIGYLAAPSASVTTQQESASVKIVPRSSVYKAVTTNVLADVPHAVSSAVSSKAVSVEAVSANSVLESTPNKSSTTPSDNRKRQLSSAEKTLPKEKKKDKKEKKEKEKEKEKKENKKTSKTSKTVLSPVSNDGSDSNISPIPMTDVMDISDANTSLAASTGNRPTSNSMGTPEMESSLAIIISKLSKLDSIEAKLDRLEYIENEVGYVRKELDEYQRSLQFTQSQLADACEVIDELKCKVQTSDDQTSKLSAKLKMLEVEDKKLHERVVQQEAYSRRENVIIDGMTETENENCEARVQEMFGRMDVGSFALQRCHRIGRRADKNRPRAIIVRFSDFGDKVKVMSQGAKLKGTGFTSRTIFQQSGQQRELR